MATLRDLLTMTLVLAAAIAGWSLSATAQQADLTEAQRQDRWRAAKNGRLSLPLPGTPDTSILPARLAAAGIDGGAPLLIRIFKADSQLEVWAKRRGTYVLFETYPICYWSGTIGPKLREGDRQAPEGFYSITMRHLHHGGRWRRSLNVGYPNPFDRINGRTGSAILVHGGCDSSGCFAMTDPVNAELYDLVSATLEAGAAHVPVHVFPFRMTDEKMAAAPTGRWTDFWRDLKRGYDSFERSRLPPHISVCGRRYRTRDATMFEREAEPIAMCPEDRHLLPEVPEFEQAVATTSGASRSKPRPPCDLSRPSCRKWVALRDRRTANRTVAGGISKRSQVR
ncbi:murein L,D-transpeptidase family protein [Hyphomicrobium sp. CS1GBMeth3]|uniref:L,D-transpeptidase family protein n=1 Tax=Hyphomicrobium sp. CS1GBMeth3 TaxID=1892845 RepID=UPI000930D7A5|nr:murein L,D-transpeptidase family protein [Hyphomicrobium sp. CS1GBMeth3]